MSWDEFDHDNEPRPEQWRCPCPECNGWTPGPPEKDESEPDWEELEESSWRWAE